MTKVRGSKGRGAAAQQDIGGGVNELASIARQHSGRGVEVPRSHEDAEDAALPAQRAVYEKVMGKKTQPARRQMAQRDERGDEADPDDEPEGDEEEERPARTRAARADHDDDDPESEETDLGDEEDDADEDEVDEDAELESAKNALRRVKAPSWVFKQPPKRLLSLAGSLADWQSNADKAIQTRDATIQALAAQRQAQAAEDGTSTDRAEGQQTPAELDKSAEELATALGVANDPETKKALIKFGMAGRNGEPGTAQTIARLERQLQDVLISSARKRLARKYEQLRSDPEAIRRFEKRVEAQARTGLYGQGNLDKLFTDSATLEFGAPEKRSTKLRPSSTLPRAREGRHPATQERRARRQSSEPRPGTEDHDRQVFNQVMKRDRARLSSRR